MSRYARKVDANQAELKAAFEKMGCSVLDLSRVGEGCPDLLVGLLGANVLVEVKNVNGKDVLEPAQLRFQREWRGARTVAHNVNDVITIVQGIRLGHRGSYL